MLRLWRWLGVAALMLVAACSSLPIAPQAAPRAIDYLTDDVADLLLAFDLPEGIEPAPGSTLSIDVTTPANGARHVRVTLAEADAGDLAGTLPPPPEGHTYYLFGFIDRDRAALQDMQAWARAVPPGSAQVAASLAPALCTAGSVDLGSVRISVLPALAGAEKLAPLLANQPLAVVVPAPRLPACSGHSG